MATRTDPVNGMVLFEQRMVDTTYLADNDASATGSDYSQAGSRPGRVAAVDGQTLAPALTGGQGDEVVGVRVQRSGLAGALGLSYALDSGTARGWLTPRACGWESLTGLWTTTNAWNLHSTVTIPATQKLITCYAEIGTGAVYCQVRHPVTGWGSAVTVTNASAEALALYLTPDGSRLILVRIGTAYRISTYYSEDEGATWEVLASAADVGQTLATPSRNEASGCFIGDDMVLFALGTGSPDPWYQYASSDGGVTWSLVGTTTTWGSVRVSGDGSRALLVGNDDATYTEYQYRLMSSAWVDVGGLTGSTIASGLPSAAGPGLCWDSDGTIYALTGYVSGGVVSFFVYQSRDAALTWGGPTLVFTSTVLDNPTFRELVTQAGQLWLISNWTVATSYDGSLTATKLATWSSVEIAGSPEGVWVPLALPSSWGWTAGGAVGGTLTSEHMQIGTSASTGYYDYAGGGHSFRPALHVITACTSGGSSTAADSILQVVSSSASATYTMRIRLDQANGQFRVVDNISGATIATVTHDVSQDTEYLLAFVGQGSAVLYYKDPDDVDWTEVAAVASHAFTDGGALVSNWSARMGHVASTTSNTLYRFAAVYDDCDEVLDGTGLLGKRITGKPYPLAEVYDADGVYGQLSVRGGAALVGEVYSIAPEYNYALQNALPGVSPSPYAAEWRSLDTSEQRIAFDLGDRTYLGGALALLIQRANFRYAYLEYHDGSAWQTIATYDAATGLSGLDFSRTGQTVFPDTGSNESSRPLHENELGDGRAWAYLANADPRKIRDSVGGWWIDSTTTVLASLNLDGITGSEASTDVLDIVCGGGLLIAYPTTRVVRRRWQIRIPAQACPDDFFRAGLIGVGRWVPFGQPWAWGGTTSLEGLYESFVDDAGAESRSQRGEGYPESWTLDWSGGVPEIDYYAEAEAPYVGISGAVPLEIVGSVLPQLRGMVRRTRGQTLPVVAVSRAPTSTTTITDKLLYLYGYPASSVSASLAAGREGSSSVQRIETLRVDAVIG